MSAAYKGVGGPLTALLLSSVSTLALSASGVLTARAKRKTAHFITEGKRVVVDLETRHDVQSNPAV